jgi:hypothetical protein
MKKSAYRQEEERAIAMNNSIPLDKIITIEERDKFLSFTEIYIYMGSVIFEPAEADAYIFAMGEYYPLYSIDSVNERIEDEDDVECLITEESMKDIAKDTLEFFENHDELEFDIATRNVNAKDVEKFSDAYDVEKFGDVNSWWGICRDEDDDY